MRRAATSSWFFFSVSCTSKIAAVNSMYPARAASSGRGRTNAPTAATRPVRAIRVAATFALAVAGTGEGLEGGSEGMGAVYSAEPCDFYKKRLPRSAGRRRLTP